MLMPTLRLATKQMGNLTKISLDVCRISKTMVVKIRRKIFSTIMGSVPAVWPSEYKNSNQG
jgi:hypothetical protein